MSLKSFTRSFTPQWGLFCCGLATLAYLIHPVAALLAILIIILLSGARENYGVLEEIGIPVVPPTLFLGSEPDIHKSIQWEEDYKRFKEFGGIWGSYVGKTPQVYIADPELIRLMFVKDFAHFADRKVVNLGTPILDEVMDFQQGEKWRILRSHVNPLFTPSKMRYMSEVIGESTAEFISDLKKECGSDKRLKIDCRRRLTAWLIDMFAWSTLGIRLEGCKDPDNKFARAFRDMMAEGQEYNKLFSLSLSFPFLTKLAPTFNDAPTKLIESTFGQLIEGRRASGIKSSKDYFLDILVDMWDHVDTKQYKDLGITKVSVVAQAVSMFLGGYETSATTLSHLLYYMAEEPELQERMYDELNDALERHGKINHELIKDKEIPFITACINEALRLAPPLIRPERICTKDWTYNDIHIKKGTLINLASWAANRHPEVYRDEPDAFKPERFLPENKDELDQYAFSTFGFGPRNCVGMRFGYETLKFFMCYFVQNFTVEKRRDTEIRYRPSQLVVGFHPVYLDIVMRK